MINAKAAVTDGRGNFSIENIVVNAPQSGEVLVKLQAAGVCHTDWDSMTWHDRFTWSDHMIMGHEGVGVVESLGQNVEGLQIGDRVLMNWAIPCHKCFQCDLENYSLCESDKHAHKNSTTWNGQAIMRSFNIGTFSTYSVVKAEALTKMESNISYTSAAIIGCAVMTGYGSVRKAAKVQENETVVVIGCGGVGLNVIQGARLAKAQKIIAIDLKESRLEMAKKFGATHVIQSSKNDIELKEASKRVKSLTDGKLADHAFESTGIPALGATPLRMVRNGGTAIQVSGIEENLTIDMNLFEWDKIYMNPLYGKCHPQEDFPELLSLYDSGELLLDELISQTYRLDELQNAFDDMLSGKNAKGVIVF